LLASPEVSKGAGSERKRPMYACFTSSTLERPWEASLAGDLAGLLPDLLLLVCLQLDRAELVNVLGHVAGLGSGFLRGDVGA
jgi:hypothetical protein